MQNTFKVRVLKSRVSWMIGREFVVCEEDSENFRVVEGALNGITIFKTRCEIIEYPKPFCEDTFNEFVATLKHPETAQEVLKQYKAYLTTKNTSKAEENAVELLKSLGYEVKKPSVAQPDEEGWIAWDGGECPVDENMWIEVMFRDEIVGKYTASCCNWYVYGNSPEDIIAYRIVNND